MKRTRQTAQQYVSQSLPGFVYLMKSEDNWYKIGRTNNVKGRLSSLRSQERHVYGDIDLLHSIATNDMCKAEADLHERFETNRISGKVDWFLLDNNEVAYIQSLERLDYPPRYDFFTTGDKATYGGCLVRVTAFSAKLHLIQVQIVGSISYEGETYIRHPFWEHDHRIHTYAGK